MTQCSSTRSSQFDDIGQSGSFSEWWREDRAEHLMPRHVPPRRGQLGIIQALGGTSLRLFHLCVGMLCVRLARAGRCGGLRH